MEPNRPTLPDNYSAEIFNHVTNMRPGTAKPKDFLSTVEREAAGLLASQENIDGLKKIVNIAKTRKSWMEQQFPQTMQDPNALKSKYRRIAETLVTEMPTYEIGEFLAEAVLGDDFDRTERRRRPIADAEGNITYKTISEEKALEEREARRSELMPKWIREIAPELIDPLNIVMLPRAGVKGFTKLAELALRAGSLEAAIGVAETSAETGKIDPVETGARAAAALFLAPAFDGLFTKARSLNDIEANRMYNSVVSRMQELKIERPEGNEYARMYRAVQDVLGEKKRPIVSRTLEKLKEKGVPYMGIEGAEVIPARARFETSNKIVKAFVDNPAVHLVAHLGGIFSTRLSRISPHTAAGVRRMDMEASTKMAQRLTKVKPFTDALKKVKKANKADYNRIKSWAFGGKEELVEDLFAKYPTLKSTINGWREVREEIYQDLIRTYSESQKAGSKWKSVVAKAKDEADTLRKAGTLSEEQIEAAYKKRLQELAKDSDVLKDVDDLLPKQIEDYFPRRWKKGKDAERVYGKSYAFRDALRKEVARKGRNLTQHEMDILASKVAASKTRTSRGVSALATKPYEKRRVLYNIDDELDNLQDLEEAIQHYIHDTTEVIEARKFWGRYFGEDGIVSDSLGENIGAFIRKERAAGRLVELSDEENLHKLLMARFGGGMNPANSTMETVRASLYLPTIGDPSSTITQIGDLATSVIVNGFRPTIGAVFDLAESKTPFGRGVELAMDDFGLNRSSIELVGPSNVAGKALDKVLTTTGFRALDRFGKNVIIGSALKDLRRTAGKNVNKLKREFGPMFNNDTEFYKFVEDLRSGDRITDDIRAAVWSRLADAQPISKSEVPVPYLNNPNWRILYQLKSWMLKQVDLIRNKGFHEARMGNYTEAAKNFTTAYLAYSAFNTPVEYARNVMLGRDVGNLDPMEVALTSPLQVYGMSTYFRDQVKQHGIVDSAWLYLLPPAGAIGEPVWDAGKRALDPDEELLSLEGFAELARAAPFGRFLYNWLGEGADKWNEYAERRNEED